MDDLSVRAGEGMVGDVGARPLGPAGPAEGESAALPAPMIAVLESSGRGGLDSVFAELLEQLDTLLPERSWERGVGNDQALQLFAPAPDSDGFWDEEVAAEVGKSTREMVSILVLIPLLTLVALGALVMTLGV